MKTLFTALLSFVLLQGYAQTETTKEDKELAKYLRTEACECIEKISTTNQTSEQVSKKISTCIDNQYSVKLLVIEANNRNIKAKDLKKKKNAKIVEDAVNFDRNAEEYTLFYYELENDLMESCSSIKSKIASNDIVHANSFTSNKEAGQLYDKALDEEKKGNLVNAISYYEKALKIDSVFVFAWDNLGLCYRKVGEYDKALEAYQKSLEIHPKGLMPLQNIAVVYQYKKDYQKSIETYQKLAELDKNNPEVYYGAGLVYALYLNEYEKGLSNLCIAYNLYIEQKSPYRSDAEKMISLVFKEMSKHGQEDLFYTILKEHNIQAK